METKIFTFHAGVILYSYQQEETEAGIGYFYGNVYLGVIYFV